MRVRARRRINALRRMIGGALAPGRVFSLAEGEMHAKPLRAHFEKLLREGSVIALESEADV